MTLNSLQFIARFFILLTILGVIKAIKRNDSSKSSSIELLLILGFSYYFIAKADYRFCICIVFATTIAYVFGILIERTNSKAVLTGGGTTLVLFLGYFKYTNFFVNSFRSIVGLDSVTLNIILPLGVSFYIFSALAYLIDVYRGDYPAENPVCQDRCQ